MPLGLGTWLGTSKIQNTHTPTRSPSHGSPCTSVHQKLDMRRASRSHRSPTEPRAHPVPESGHIDVRAQDMKNEEERG